MKTGNNIRAVNSIRGFSLIELMIVVSVFALFLVMASPTLRVYHENSKVRNVAESIAAAMQKARTLAIRDNVQVEVVLYQVGGNFVSWTISRLNTTVAPPVRFVPPEETFVWGAGGHNWSSVAVTPVNGTNATFERGLGVLLPNNPPMVAPPPSATPPTNITVTSTSGLPGARRLQVNVQAAGGIRVCDLDLPATDPKSCGFTP